MQGRPYQVDALNRARRAFGRGVRRMILSGPCGCGKTFMAGEIIKGAVSKGRKVLFVADRRVLVGQASKSFDRMGIDHGIIMAGYGRRFSAPVDVASAQTLETIEWWHDPKPGESPYGLIVVDECHDRRSATENFFVTTDTPTVGLTATPFTKGLGLPLEGKEELGSVYQEMVTVVTTNRLVSDGYLVPFEVWVCKEIDLSKVKTVNGEYGRGSVAQAAKEITGDVVNEWRVRTKAKFGGPVPTIVFSSTVDRGEELVEEFGKQGFPFGQISYRDKDPAERDRKITALERGDLIGLISCEALAKGFDETSIQCVVMERPYKKSLDKVLQALGRGARSHPGKEDCLLLDHSGNFLRFSTQIESFFESGWDDLENVTRRSAAKPGPEDEGRQCKGCGFVMSRGARACPACGLEVPIAKKETVVLPGRMERYVSLSHDVGGDIWPHISRMAVDRFPSDRERAVKWARVQYKSLSGSWPKFGRMLQPSEICDHRVREAVNQEVRKWIRQRHAIRKKEEKALARQA